jgi:probable lipoprotein (TIGR04455 family)
MALKILILLFLFNCSSVSYKFRIKNLNQEVDTLKRIQVQVNPKGLNENRVNLMEEFVSKEFSHRTNYIVYPPKEKSKKIESVYYIELKEKLKLNTLQLEAKVYLVRIKDRKLIWQINCSSNYDTLSEDNKPIVDSSIEKFGSEVKSYSNAYFEFAKLIVSETTKPSNLSDEETDEKIEIESK